MTRSLTPVLTAHDLPIAELTAARLDGEVFGVDGCFAPVDEIEQPAHRVLALRSAVHDRLIAEQLTAAWIWGALSAPPAHHQFCAALGARVSRTSVPWRSVREVVIDPEELVLVNGMHVTTPLRTIVDIARFADTFTHRHAHAILALQRVSGIGPADVVVEINRRRNLPGKRRALARIDAVHVVHGVDAPHGVEHPVEMSGVTHLEYESTEREALA